MISRRQFPAMARPRSERSARSPPPMGSRSSRCCGRASPRYDLRPDRWPAGLELDDRGARRHPRLPALDARRSASAPSWTTTNGLGADLIVLLGDYVAGHRFVTGQVDARDMGGGALSGLRGAARRARDPRQPRMVVGPRGPARRRRACPPAGARWRRSAFRSTRTTRCVSTKRGDAFWLAGLGDQLAFLPSRRRWPGSTHRRRRSRRHAGEGDR